MPKQTWSSRLPDREADPLFETLNASVGFDGRLVREEVQATKAHAAALEGAGIYTPEERALVAATLERVEREILSGDLALAGFEDIHSAVEHRLTQLTGEAGEKIQTGRSRNEQTVTAQRLFLKKAVEAVGKGVTALQKAVVDRAASSIDVIMPGFTHGRPAQPVRFAHYLASHFFGLERDKGRLLDAGKRLDASPAGVAALAGTAFPLDREALAADLGFGRLAENALDAVSDRDGQLEVLSALAILMVRLSRLAEDLILWSSPAYGFLSLGDTYCTSSSLMPQKKNPDGLELCRGKTGRVISDLLSLLVTCKGLPAGYQKDLQEDKEPLFDALDTAELCLAVAAGVVEEMTVHAEAMAAAVTRDCLATDRADDLVRQGVPFRRAYAAVAGEFGEAVAQRREPPAPASSVRESVEKRDVPGGVSRRAVYEQLQAAEALLKGASDTAE